MIDETLIASLAIDDSDADALLNEMFGSDVDAAMEKLVGERVSDLSPGKLIKGRVIGFSSATTSSSRSASRAKA
jgi:hypothetical protein